MYITAVTGHRPDKLGGYNEMAEFKLVRFAEFMIKKNWCETDTFITGMAQGWDTAIADACLALSIPFIAHIPFVGQELAWPKAAQDHYNYLLNKAKEVVTVTNNYSKAAFFKRNESMVDASNRVMALYDGSRGGTAHCVNYARAKGKEPLNVWPQWLEFN